MTDPSTNDTASSCPTCAAPITAHRGFVSWCPACEWNLDPSPQQLWTPSGLDRVALDLSRRRGDALYREVLADPSSLDHRRRSIAGFALAAGVHLLTMAVLVGGVALFTIDNWFARLAGALFIATAVWLMPTALLRSPKEPVLTRAELPVLFELVDEIAAAVGTRTVDTVTLTAELNASVQRVRLRRHLRLGVPLVSALSPNELVALVAHELGHFGNGDPNRTAFVWTAADAAHRWVLILTPAKPQLRIRLSETLAALVMRVVRFPAIVFLRILLLVTWRQSQVGEYRADLSMARVAGTDAAIGVLGTFPLSEAFQRVMQQAVVADELRPWLGLTAYRAELPALEVERRIRLSSLPGRRRDTTHPPDAFRIGLLRRASHEDGTVNLDAARRTALHSELDRHGDQVAQALFHQIGRVLPGRSMRRSDGAGT